jgi:hypothetical protein
MRLRILLLFFLGIALVACGGATGQNAASTQLKTPEIPSDRGTKCKVAKSQSEPLVVEWPDTARGKLESASSKGLVAVRYEGCELQVLSRCRVKEGKYNWTPITRKSSRVTIKDADELYANMPVGAIKLESKLASAGQLNVQMTIVGRYEAPGSRVYRDDLEGECSEATHVVAALTVGAFTFFAGADAEVGGGASVAGVAGGGGKSTAQRETLEKDGDETACSRASASDKGPPEGCGALLQIEVMPLAKGSKAVAAPVPVPVPTPAPSSSSPPSSTPPPPTGTGRSAGTGGGGTAVGGFGTGTGGIGTLKPGTKKPAIATKPKKCLKDEKLENGECVKKIAGVKPAPTPTCLSTQHIVDGHCVDDEPPPPEPSPPPPQPPPPLECPQGTRREGNACVVDHSQEPAHPPPPVPEYGNQQQQQQEDRPNPVRTLFAYGALGFGLTFLVAGGVAVGAAADAKKECDTDKQTCSTQYADKAKTARTWAVVADVSLGLTVISVIGIYLIPSKTTVGVTPTRNGATLGASGSF